MRVKKAILSAPGKIIISGEHAGVYGHPVLVAAIDKRIKLTVDRKKNGFNFYFRSEIPSQSGLGSSASLAALEAAALSLIAGNESLDKKVINQMAFNLEEVVHGTPSGVDNTIAVYGGILLYQKKKGFKEIKFRKLPKFLLVNTGKPLENTGKMVVGVVGREVKEKNTKTINSLKKIASLPERFIKTLKSKDYKQLKDLILENERLLEEIGVVGPRAKKIIREIEDLGGAAKISGGGGLRKGSGIALVYHQNLKIIRNYCQKEKLDCFEVKLGGEGIRLEK